MEPLLRTVYIYGKLRKRCGVDKIEIAGDTVSALVRGVAANFHKQLKPNVNKPRLACRVKGYDTKESLFKLLPADVTEIHLYPVLGGAGGGKGGGFFKIILGALLLVAYIYLNVITGGSYALSPLGQIHLNISIGLIMAGIIQVLTPQPNPNSADEAQNRYLGATGNTVRIGTPIPLLFGRHRVFGHFLSFNVDPIDVAPSD